MSTPCDCREHRCTPPAVQTARYATTVYDPDRRRLILLCAHCYINGHMAIWPQRMIAPKRADAPE